MSAFPAAKVKRKPVLQSPPLKTVIYQVKFQVDLPINDLAQLFGIKRRQLYYVLDGRSPGLETEQRIRLVHSVFADIDDALEGSEGNLRNAILMPATDDYRSLFDVIKSGDEDEIRSVAKSLVGRIERKETSATLPVPSPTYAVFGSDEEIIRGMKESR